MIIPQGKVLVRAGKFEGGKLPYVNYVGQIKPADMPRILWWGAYGNDATGDGSISNPFLTFDRALDAFSTTQHKWILKTDLSVYGETGPGPYIDNPAGRVYLDPTRPDDSGDGLTPATAKQTYAAAKTALTLSGRSSIHCIGSFTLTSAIDAATQGEIGQTITLDAVASQPGASLLFAGTFAENMVMCGIVKTPTHLVAIGFNNSTGAPIVMRSADDGATWVTIATPWTGGVPRDISYNGSVIVVTRDAGSQNRQVAYSLDNGATWTQVLIVSNGSGIRIVWSGSLFVATVFVSTQWRIYTSPDGITWTLRHSAAQEYISTDGAGRVHVFGAAVSLYSTNHGVSWSTGTAIPTPGTPRSGVYGGGKWYVFTFGSAPRLFIADSPLSPWTEIVTSFDYTNRAVWRAVYSENLQAVIGYQNNLAVGASKLRLFTQSGSVPFLTVSVGLDGFLPGCLLTRSGDDEILYLAGGTDNSLVRRIESVKIDYGNIRSDSCNLLIHSSKSAVIAPNVKVQNISADSVSGNSFETASGASVWLCRAVAQSGSALVHRGNKIKVRRSIFKAPASAVDIQGTANANGDIEVSQSIIDGGMELNNAGGTDKEYIIDNIIEGGFSAAALVTVRSNIRGAVTGTTAISKISSVNPVFADTTDYFLSRVALGQAADSPLIKRSTEFLYTYNSQTYKDDLGPYRAFVALVTILYKRAFLLPKFSGEALSEDVQNSAKLLQSINGVPDVSNRPSARMELISWEAKTIDENVREAVSYMERELNTGVELFYDFEPTMLDGVTVNGAHPAETFEINIQPKDIPVGTAIIVDGKTRYVVQRYPRSGDATKIVIDDVLQGGLSNGQVLDIELMQGGGSFVFVPQETRKNRRVFSRRRDAYKGMVFTFARKLT